MPWRYVWECFGTDDAILLRLLRCGVQVCRRVYVCNSGGVSARHLQPRRCTVVYAVSRRPVRLRTRTDDGELLWGVRSWVHVSPRVHQRHRSCLLSGKIQQRGSGGVYVVSCRSIRQQHGS
jgi:hypothetical protein